MSVFLDMLGNDAPSVESWHLVLFDQLHEQLLPKDINPEKTGLLFIETTWKTRQLPYHKQKLALVLSNQRHYALEMKKRGFEIRYEFSIDSYADVLRNLSVKLGPITVTEPAEYGIRTSFTALEDNGVIQSLPHTGWMTSTSDFIDAVGDKPPWRMDKFYRYIRKKKKILVDENLKPVGGDWSYDSQNRLPWDGAVELPALPSFEPNAVTQEVVQMIEQQFNHHPGVLRIESLPSTDEHAEALWNWAKSTVMFWFGPYEDAMTIEHTTLFHTTISSLLNLNRLQAKTVVNEAIALDIPLHSKEGFVRQILGWREFVRHVHTKTDGFQSEVPEDAAFVRPGAGWEGEWAQPRSTMNVLEAKYPLPKTFWGAKSGMLCLDSAVEQVVETGYTHHIPRLMVLANIGTLLGVNPRELTDWFWAMFTDAYDWVVEPNVLAMGTYAVGEVMTTKPYVCGTPYIKKMGDYCGDCSLHHKKSCPISDMYWDFLEINKEHFNKNHRMFMPMRNLAKRDAEKIEKSRRVVKYVRSKLSEGVVVNPTELEKLKS